MNEPWKTEPNYLKWIDAATGYPCMIWRVDHTGALAGIKLRMEEMARTA